MRPDWLAWTGRGGGPAEPVGPALSVPVANVYYLLCYARNRLDARDLIDVGALDGGTPADLFAEILAAGVQRLRRRGVPRRYRTREEDTGAPRGRLELSPSITGGLLMRGRVRCTIDELTVDIAFNRALKAALRVLAGRPEVSVDRRRTLRRHVVALGPVADVRLSSDLLRSARSEGHVGLHDMLLGVCELAWLAGLPSAEGAGRAFLDLAADARVFGRVFEDFVLGWFRAEQRVFHARKAQVPWQVDASASDRALLPTMEGDVLLASAATRILVECKAYSQTLVYRYGAGKVRSDHLYQLLTYLEHLAADGGPPVAGLLLYARAEVDLDLEWTLGPHRVLALTLDLRRPWRDIEGALRSLTTRLRDLRPGRVPPGNTVLQAGFPA